MKFFAIGDLHLSFGTDKPMDIFGAEWEGHAEKIAHYWRELVGPEDVVFVVGDISWAMHLPEVAPDLQWLGGLPGCKIIIKGNHDYWWSKLSRITPWLPEGIFALQGSSMKLGSVAVAGTRGWTLPGTPIFNEERDRKIYQRECLRLENALRSLGEAHSMPLVVLLHFPPLMSGGEPTCYTRLLERYHCDLCLYGHLHGKDRELAFEGVLNGVMYRLVSCDHIGFSPVVVKFRRDKQLFAAPALSRKWNDLASKV